LKTLIRTQEEQIEKANEEKASMKKELEEAFNELAGAQEELKETIS